MPSPVDSLLQSVRASLEAGELEPAFRELGEFVRFVNAAPSRWARIPGSFELDALCVELGDALLSLEPDFDSPPLPAGPLPGADGHLPQLYVVSELHPSGGHSGWLLDLIRSQPDRNHIVLVTDLHNRSPRDALGEAWEIPHLHLEWPDREQSWTGRARWLASHLSRHDHCRVFLITHQEDAPAIAAAAAARLSRFHFCHHADYTMALGLFLPDAVHVDLSPASWHLCRHRPGMGPAAYLPLVTEALPARDPGGFRWGPGDEGFVTCSAGPAQKFEHPYDYSYADLIPELLTRTGGRHLHIGNLSHGYLERMRAAFTRSGVEWERFQHLSRVPSLAAALCEHDVSLYLNSFPLGGTRSIVEIMSGGTPILGHIHYASSLLSSHALLYPEAELWLTPGHFLNLVQSFVPEKLAAHSTFARRHWERRHRRSLLAGLLSAPSLPLDYAPPEPVDLPDNPLRAELETWEGADPWAVHQDEIESLEARCATLTGSLDRSQNELETALSRQHGAEAELDELRRSLSWRGLRWFKRHTPAGSSPQKEAQ